MALMFILLLNIDQELVYENLLAFGSIDVNNSGQLDQEELTRAIEALKEDLVDLRDFTPDDISAIFEKLDLDNTGLLTYS